MSARASRTGDASQVVGLEAVQDAVGDELPGQPVGGDAARGQGGGRARADRADLDAGQRPAVLAGRQQPLPERVDAVGAGEDDPAEPPDLARWRRRTAPGPRRADLDGRVLQRDGAKLDEARREGAGLLAGARDQHPQAGQRQPRPPVQRRRAARRRRRRPGRPAGAGSASRTRSTMSPSVPATTSCSGVVAQRIAATGCIGRAAVAQQALDDRLQVLDAHQEDERVRAVREAGPADRAAFLGRDPRGRSPPRTTRRPGGGSPGCRRSSARRWTT